MSLQGLSAVQSRISAIQDKINSMSSNGRPPVSILESGATSTNSTSVSDSVFSSEIAKQVRVANLAGAKPVSAAGQVQGVAGTAEAFVQKVRSYIGVPYVWGGTDPAKGLDCSGLVQTAAKEVGINLPRVTYDQQHAGIEINSIENAKPGDIIITNKSRHVVVYIGDGKVIHAPRPGKTVTEAKLSDLGPIVSIRRIMKSAGDPPNTTAVPTAAFNSLTNANNLATLLSGTTPATPNPDDLASSLVNVLSGKSVLDSSGSVTALGAAGATRHAANYSSAWLSQFMNASTTANNTSVNTGLAALTSGASKSMTSTASALNTVSTLRNALGV